MPFFVAPKEQTMDCFHDVLKKLGAVGGEIEDNRQGEQNQRKFYA